MSSDRCGVRIHNGPDSDDPKVKEWAKEHSIRFWYGDTIFDINTRKVEQTYFFKNEQDKLIFILRWSNTR